MNHIHDDDPISIFDETEESNSLQYDPSQLTRVYELLSTNDQTAESLAPYHTSHIVDLPPIQTDPTTNPKIVQIRHIPYTALTMDEIRRRRTGINRSITPLQFKAEYSLTAVALAEQLDLTISPSIPLLPPQMLPNTIPTHPNANFQQSSTQQNIPINNNSLNTNNTNLSSQPTPLEIPPPPPLPVDDILVDAPMKVIQQAIDREVAQYSILLQPQKQHIDQSTPLTTNLIPDLSNLPRFGTTIPNILDLEGPLEHLKQGRFQSLLEKPLPTGKNAIKLKDLITLHSSLDPSEVIPLDPDQVMIKICVFDSFTQMLMVEAIFTDDMTLSSLRDVIGTQCPLDQADLYDQEHHIPRRIEIERPQDIYLENVQNKLVQNMYTNKMEEYGYGNNIWLSPIELESRLYYKEKRKECFITLLKEYQLELKYSNNNLSQAEQILLIEQLALQYNIQLHDLNELNNDNDDSMNNNNDILNNINITNEERDIQQRFNHLMHDNNNDNNDIINNNNNDGDDDEPVDDNEDDLDEPEDDELTTTTTTKDKKCNSTSKTKRLSRKAILKRKAGVFGNNNNNKKGPIKNPYDNNPFQLINNNINTTTTTNFQLTTQFINEMYQFETELQRITSGLNAISGLSQPFNDPYQKPIFQQHHFPQYAIDFNSEPIIETTIELPLTLGDYLNCQFKSKFGRGDIIPSNLRGYHLRQQYEENFRLWSEKWYPLYLYSPNGLLPSNLQHICNIEKPLHFPQYAYGWLPQTILLPHPSSFFFIGDTFYDDRRSPLSISLSDSIIQHSIQQHQIYDTHCLPIIPDQTTTSTTTNNDNNNNNNNEEEQQQQPPFTLPEPNPLEPKIAQQRHLHDGYGIFKQFRQETTTFGTIPIRIGEQYLFQHQGNCQHIIMFTEMRIKSTEDYNDKRMYPLVIYRSNENILHRQKHHNLFVKSGILRHVPMNKENAYLLKRFDLKQSTSLIPEFDEIDFDPNIISPYIQTNSSTHSKNMTYDPFIEQLSQCLSCDKNATKLVYADRLCPISPAPLCERCLSMLHHVPIHENYYNGKGGVIIPSLQPFINLKLNELSHSINHIKNNNNDRDNNNIDSILTPVHLHKSSQVQHKTVYEIMEEYDQHCYHPDDYLTPFTSSNRDETNSTSNITMEMSDQMNTKGKKLKSKQATMGDDDDDSDIIFHDTTTTTTKSIQSINQQDEQQQSNQQQQADDEQQQLSPQQQLPIPPHYFQQLEPKQFPSLSTTPFIPIEPSAAQFDLHHAINTMNLYTEPKYNDYDAKRLFPIPDLHKLPTQIIKVKLKRTTKMVETLQVNVDNNVTLQSIQNQHENENNEQIDQINQIFTDGNAMTNYFYQCIGLLPNTYTNPNINHQQLVAEYQKLTQHRPQQPQQPRQPQQPQQSQQTQ